MYRQSLAYLSEWLQLKNRKPLLIQGARQVGKSTLVRLLAIQSKLELVELNLKRNPELATLFKSNNPHKIIQLISIQTGKNIESGQTLLFIDEVQEVTEAIVALRYFYTELPTLHVVAAGSLLEFAFTTTNLSTLGGQIEHLYLGPMSFVEFLLAINAQSLADFIQSYHLDEEIPQPIHTKLMELIKVYFITGGMPESILAYFGDNTFKACEKVKQSILVTYRDDFGKYASLTKHDLIRKVFTKIPAMIGNKFKYSNISRDIKPALIATALEQLYLAKIVWKVHHSSANRIPLSVEQNDRFFKVLFLDIGLVSTNLGINYLNLLEANELNLVNSGSLTEQFIGQHLLYVKNTSVEPELHYWAREKKSAAAELDYVINLGNQIIPIEVKAGKTGRMKSLHLFLREKQGRLGVRFNSAPPSLMDAHSKLVDGSQIHFKFLSLPLYLVSELNRLVAKIDYIP